MTAGRRAVRRRAYRYSADCARPVQKKALSSHGGFTLLEVTASLAILGVGIMLALELFSGGLRLARRSDEDTWMALLAGQQMSRMIASKELKKETAGGVTEDGYKWNIEVAPFTPSPSTRPGCVIFKITVNVSRPNRDKDGFTITTLRTVFTAGDGQGI